MVTDRFISEPNRDWRPPEVTWPDGKTFAFAVFDDPDFQTVERGRPVYDFLSGLGFRTTRGIFPGLKLTPASYYSVTCNDPAHLQWVLSLKERGFEVGWHGASPVSSTREQTIEGLERFRQLFGDWPYTSSQHYECGENMYLGGRAAFIPATPSRL